jgi:hypothetical protein
MRFLILALLSFLSVSAPTAQTTTRQAVRGDRVVIQSRRIVLRRPREIVKEFPERRTAVVTYPVISGLGDPAVLRKVRAAIEFKNIFDYSLAEYRSDAWLSEFGYVVNYNRNYMLDITFRQSGMGAYPDEQEKHFLINLKDGSIVKASDVFDADKINQIIAVVDRQLQREIERILSKVKDPEEKAAMKEAFDNLKFEAKDVDQFSVSDAGVTFLYDPGFPHVIKAWEPSGRYFFGYDSLRRFITRDGLLGRFKG